MSNIPQNHFYFLTNAVIEKTILVVLMKITVKDSKDKDCVRSSIVVISKNSISLFSSF